MKIETHIEIEASKEAVWAAITDFASFADWNPFLTRMTGEARQGAGIRMITRTGALASLPLSIAATINAFEPGEYLCWNGGVRGFLYGYHSFRITELGGGQVRLDHDEHFSGLLKYFMRGPLMRGLIKSYDAMNAAVKQRVEPLAA